MSCVDDADPVDTVREESQARMRALAMEVRHVNEAARRKREQVADHAYVGFGHPGSADICLKNVKDGEGWQRCRLTRSAHPDGRTEQGPQATPDLLASPALEAALIKSEGIKEVPRLVDYRLPGGRVVAIQFDHGQHAPVTVAFSLEAGPVVIAWRVSQ